MSQRDISTIKKADRNKLAWSVRVSQLETCPIRDLLPRIQAIAAGMLGKRCNNKYDVPRGGDVDTYKCERPMGHDGDCGSYSHGEEFELQLVLRGNHDAEEDEET